MRAFLPLRGGLRRWPRSFWLALAVFVVAAVLWAHGPIAQWVDYHAFADARAWLGVPNAAILMPLGFFLSVLQPRAEQPSGAIRLVYVGAMVLAIAVVIAGIGLIHAAIALSSSGGAPLV